MRSQSPLRLVSGDIIRNSKAPPGEWTKFESAETVAAEQSAANSGDSGVFYYCELRTAPGQKVRVNGFVAAKLAAHYGLIPPDSVGLHGSGETLTYAAQRILTRHSMAREFSPDIRKFGEGLGSSAPEGGFAWYAGIWPCLCYSYLNATMGSTLVARRAGK